MAQWSESLLRARYLVGSLGEDAGTPWWTTTVTNAVGQRMLTRLFPRTAPVAGLETVSRAAALVHDRQIGRLGAYHLFRLPMAEELALAEALRTPAADALLAALIALPDRAARLDALSALAAGERAERAYGPMHLGEPRGLRRGKTLQRLCAVYQGAFAAGRSAYPFLLEAGRL